MRFIYSSAILLVLLAKTSFGAMTLPIPEEEFSRSFLNPGPSLKDPFLDPLPHMALPHKALEEDPSAVPMSHALRIMDTKVPVPHEFNQSEFELVGVGLFRAEKGAAGMISAAIGGLTQSKWSHVAVILKDVKTGKWYSFESTGSADQVLKGMLPQVQLAPWTDVLDKYQGSVAIRLLTFEEGKQPSNEMMTEFVREYVGKPYQFNALRLVQSLFQGHQKEDANGIICSQLTATLLQKAGLLPDTCIPGNFLPWHFSEESTLKLQGATLESQALLKQSPGFFPRAIETLSLSYTFAKEAFFGKGTPDPLYKVAQSVLKVADPVIQLASAVTESVVSGVMNAGSALVNAGQKAAGFLKSGFKRLFGR